MWGPGKLEPKSCIFACLGTAEATRLQQSPEWNSFKSGISNFLYQVPACVCFACGLAFHLCYVVGVRSGHA